MNFIFRVILDLENDYEGKTESSNILYTCCPDY